MERKRYIVENNISLIKEWESKRTPLMEVARRLNLKYDTLKKYLNILGVQYKINQSRKGLKHPERRASLEQVLNNNSTNSKKKKKKKKAYRRRYKRRKM